MSKELILALEYELTSPKQDMNHSEINHLIN